MTQKKAFITGVTGQDGFYLAELLLSKGYQVHGLERRSSLIKTDRLLPVLDNKDFHLHYGDMTDTSNLTRILAEVKPDEIYNLAAQSHVKVSFDVPEYTANADGIGALRILEALRTLGLTKTRFYQASTSELYGLVQETPQKETTPFYPRSPYAVAKLYAYWITVNYRESYDMYACNGILFNHESPLRGETFVTRKITRAAAAISKGLQETLYLGNLDSLRDWGHARDYVEGMWRMLQQEKAEDFVLATGKMHTVRDFVNMAFKAINVELDWKGEADSETGICRKTGKTLVAVDPKFYRPAEVELLLGDPSKAKAKLGWEATTTLEQMVKEMVESDLESVDARQALMSRAA